jgi:hypothetical protein
MLLVLSRCFLNKELLQNFRGEANDIMKKQLVIIGIIVLLVSVGLSGCSTPEQTTGPNPEDLIIGTWYYDAEGTKVNFIFYENHSMCVSYGGQSIWTEYEITKDSLTFINLTDEQTAPGKYSFSDNNNTLTIITDFSSTIILTRQQEMKL